MDIDEQFYYLALGTIGSTSAGESLLVGIDFRGGLSTETLPFLCNCGWIANSSGQRHLKGALGMIHQQGRGNKLVLSDQELLTFPCVLSTNPNLHWLYSGEVDAIANDESFDFKELGELGIPLSGENWMGVLRWCGDELWLDAFSTGDVPMGRTLNAFCPDWNVGFDEQDALIFRIKTRAVS